MFRRALLRDSPPPSRSVFEWAKVWKLSVDAAVEYEQGRREDHGKSRFCEGKRGTAQERDHGHSGDGGEQEGVDVWLGRTDCNLEHGGDSEADGTVVTCILVACLENRQFVLHPVL